MASEKTGVTVSDADPSPEEEFRQFGTSMQGERYQHGGQHDLEGRGYGSGVGVAQRGDHDPNMLMESTERREVPDFVQDNDNTNEPEPEQDWKRMYGQSENEKFEMRKSADALKSEIEQMRNELANMRSYSQPPVGATQGYQQYAQRPAQAPTEQVPETFFPGKEQGDLMEVSEVDRILKNVIAPAYLQLNAQQQALQQAQIQAAKASAGVTPAIEQRLLSTHPWLQNVPDGIGRIQAMQDILQQAKQASEQPRRQQPARPAQVNPEQAAARRVTYIESNRQSKPSESEVPLQQRIAQEFSAAKTAAEKKAVLIKYGMQHVNDWGPDVWGPVR